MEQDEIISKTVDSVVSEREIITLTPTQTLSANRTPVKNSNSISSGLQNSPVFVAPNGPVSFKSTKQGSSIAFDFSLEKKDKSESSFFSLDVFKSVIASPFLLIILFITFFK